MARPEDLQGQGPEGQPEKELKPPELAKEVHDIIDGVKEGLKRTPQFVDALVNHYLDTQRGAVYYQREEGGPSCGVDFKTEIEYDYDVEVETHNRFYEKRRLEEMTFAKYTKNPEGEIGTWRMYAWSEYVDNKPTRGRIRVTNTPGNTATAVQGARNFFRAEFGEPQVQPPTGK
jgi:hypothetical protein